MTVPPQATGRVRLPVGAAVINKSAAWRSVGGFSKGTKVIELSESEQRGEVLKGRTTTSCTPVKEKMIALGGGVVIVILFCIFKCQMLHKAWYLQCLYLFCFLSNCSAILPPTLHVAGIYPPLQNGRHGHASCTYFKALLCFLVAFRREKFSSSLP